MVERWLTGIHDRLRRLPPVDRAAASVPERRTRAFPPSHTDRAHSAASRERWRPVYEEVRRRHAAGETLLGIAKAMGLARATVRKYAQAERFPERAARAPGPSVLDPFIPHLEQRLAAGCENAIALWRELQDLGYTGKARRVHLWLQDRRTAPASSTPHRWRGTMAPQPRD
ncbi:hypothetical protein [Azospirillum doebereinerae]